MGSGPEEPPWAPEAQSEGFPSESCLLPWKKGVDGLSASSWVCRRGPGPHKAQVNPLVGEVIIPYSHIRKLRHKEVA